MKIREFNPADIKPMAAIYNYHIINTSVVFETEAFDDRKMSDMIEGIARDYPVIVAESSEGEVIGYAYAHAWKSKPAYRTTAESTLYVREDFKGQGVGKQLLNALVGECVKAGIHVLIACITEENEESRRFHEKNGFMKVSEFKEVGRKFGRWLDVTDYELIISDLIFSEKSMGKIEI